MVHNKYKGTAAMICLLLAWILLTGLFTSTFAAEDPYAGDDLPASITVHLYRDGEWVDSQQVTAATNWQYEWNNLPKRDPDTGREYVYTVKEEPIPGWDATVEGYDITNTPVPTIDIAGEKTWDENGVSDPVYPAAIEIGLLRNGIPYQSLTVSPGSDGRWLYRFEGLPKEDAAGTLYNYQVVEELVPGWESAVDGYNIENKALRVKMRDISVEKVWDTGGETILLPQSVTVYLYRDGTLLDSKQLTAADNWQYTWQGLPETDEDEIPYTYTVKEDVPDFWHGRVEESGGGFVVTNTAITSIDIHGEKSVVSMGNPPAQDYVVELSLHRMYRDDFYNRGLDVEDDEALIRALSTQIDTVAMAIGQSADEVPFHFTGLPLYDSSGRQYIYFVYEDNPPSVFIAICEYGPEDYNHYDITNLYVGGNPSENPARGFTFTFQKEWNDNSDRGGNRPSEIKLAIYRTEMLSSNVRPTDPDAYSYLQTIVLNAQNGWQYQKYFVTEPSSMTGNKYYFYDVREVEVPTGYELKGIHFDSISCTFTITNALPADGEDEYGKLRGTKSWDDNDDLFSLRPESVTVDLYCVTAQGDIWVDSRLVSADTDWQYEFVTYNKYGGLYSLGFYVREREVQHYTVTGGGTATGPDIVCNLTNTLNRPSVTLSFSLTKRWLDNSNAAGIRPATITVRLLANGVALPEKELTLDVSAGATQNYTWRDLPAFDSAGNVIHYTAEEVLPPGYYNETEYGENGRSAVITNRLVLEETVVKGVKIWLQARAGFSLLKISEDSTPLAGAQFELYGADRVTKVGEGITGPDGKLHFEDLATGTYWLKEVRAPDGHYLPDDPWWEVVLAVGDKPEIAIFTVTNETEKPGRIALQKVDAENSDTVLTGAKFRLYQCAHEHSAACGGADDEILCTHVHTQLLTDYNIGVDGCWQSVGAEKETDSNGVVAFDNLPCGRYLLAETQAPSGYQLPAGQWIITIAEVGGQSAVTDVQAWGDAAGIPALRRPEGMNPLELDLLVPNRRIHILPLAGGGGLRGHILIGAVLLATGIHFLIRRKQGNRPSRTGLK